MKKTVTHNAPDGRTGFEFRELLEILEGHEDDDLITAQSSLVKVRTGFHGQIKQITFEFE